MILRYPLVLIIFDNTTQDTPKSFSIAACFLVFACATGHLASNEDSVFSFPMAAKYRLMDFELGACDFRGDPAAASRAVSIEKFDQATPGNIEALTHAHFSYRASILVVRDDRHITPDRIPAALQLGDLGILSCSSSSALGSGGCGTGTGVGEGLDVGGGLGQAGFSADAGQLRERVPPDYARERSNPRVSFLASETQYTSPKNSETSGEEEKRRRETRARF